MSSDRLQTARQCLARLEERLAGADDPGAGGDELRAVVHELSAVASELETGERTVAAVRRAFEVRRQRAMNPSEDRFAGVFEHAPIGMALVETDGRTFQVNHALCEMFGYSEEELISGALVEITPAEEIALAVARSQELLRGECRSYQLEKRFRHKDGRVVTALLSVSLVRGATPDASYFICQLADISDRRRAEEALRASEERFRALVENASDVVSLLDAEGRLLYNSPNVTRVFGYDPSAALGRVTTLEGVHPDDVERARAQFQAALTRPECPVTGELRVRRADGSWLWVEGTLCNMLDVPHVRALVVNSRDVTERKRAAEAYHNLVEHSLQGLVVYQDGRIVFANPALAEMLGYSAAEITAMSVEQANTLLHPDDRAAILDSFAEVLAGQPVPHHIEFRSPHRNGKVRWLASSVSRTEFRGRPAVQAATIDITDRKLAEEVARQRQAELAHVLRVNTVGEMASGLAHELNQPLAAIVNYARGCVRRLQGRRQSEELLEPLDRIAAEALRAAGIVRGLRQFLRQEPPRHVCQDVNTLVAEAVRLVEADARQQGVTVAVELAPGLPSAEVDRVQFEQVVVNLVRNGLEAMSRGSDLPRQLSIRTSMADGESITVSVRDRGEGVAADVAEKIFEPFFTTKATGLGMGLSISRSIVHAHGGRIWATPNADGGTTFSFALPVRGCRNVEC